MTQVNNAIYRSRKIYTECNSWKWWKTHEISMWNFGKSYNIGDDLISMDKSLPNTSDRKTNKKILGENILLKTYYVELALIFLEMNFLY